MTNEKSIKINTDNLTGSAAPLYHQFDGQINSQPAYIEIDPRGEEIEISADYIGDFGNGVSGRVWHNLVTQITCPAGVLGSDLIAHLESDDFKKDVLELCEGYKADFNNQSNLTGYWNENARDIEAGMEDALLQLSVAEIYEGEEWIEEDANYLNEYGNPCDYAYEATSAKYGDIDITTENIGKLVKAAEEYIDEASQVVFGIEEAFESIIADFES